jgi:hypothetical protein
MLQSWRCSQRFLTATHPKSGIFSTFQDGNCKSHTVCTVTMPIRGIRAVWHADPRLFWSNFPSKTELTSDNTSSEIHRLGLVSGDKVWGVGMALLSSNGE